MIRTNLQANKPLDQTTKAYTFRMLFTLGLLAKQFDLDSNQLKQFEVNIFILSVENFLNNFNYLLRFARKTIFSIYTCFSLSNRI